MATQYLFSRSRPPRPAAGGRQTRLSWWAVALPALAFVGPPAGEPPWHLAGRLLEAVQGLLQRLR